MRKILLAIGLLASASLAVAQSGPKYGKNGGIGSSSSTYQDGEPTGGTYAINGTTGTVSTPIVNLRPGTAPVSPQNGDCWTTVAGFFCRINGATVGPYGASGGTVTSVGIAPPPIFTAGSPVTGSGDLSFSLNSQAAATVFAAPIGSTGAPTFRALVGSDIPAVSLGISGNGGVAGSLAIASGGTGATTALGATSNIQVQNAFSGSAVRSVSNKLGDDVNVLDFTGCDSTGATNSTTCFQNALNAFSGGKGGVVHFRGKYLLNSLTVPPGVSLKGECEMPGSPGTNASYPYGNYTCGVLMMNGGGSVTLSGGSNITSALIYRAGMTFPVTDATTFAGTAVVTGGDDTSLTNVMVMGFARAFFSSGYQRARIVNFYGDNQAGIEITNSADVNYLTNIHQWPFSSVTQPGLNAATRTGAAIYLHDFVDWTKITNAFSWGYFRGIRLNNVDSTQIVASGADNIYSTQPDHAGSIGLAIEGTSRETTVMGFQSAANETAGVYQNTSGSVNYSNVSVWGGSTHGVWVAQGDATIVNSSLGVLNGIVNGVTVSGTASRVGVSNTRFGAIAGNPLNVAVANSTTYANDNDFGSYAASVASGNLTVPSVASASSLVLPNTGRLFNVTGSATILTIDNGWAGRCLTLIFGGAATVTNNVAAFNAVRLAGGVNFTSVANGSLTICHNGVRWYETARTN